MELLATTQRVSTTLATTQRVATTVSSMVLLATTKRVATTILATTERVATTERGWPLLGPLLFLLPLIRLWPTVCHNMIVATMVMMKLPLIFILFLFHVTNLFLEHWKRTHKDQESRPSKHTCKLFTVDPSLCRLDRCLRLDSQLIENGICQKRTTKTNQDKLFTVDGGLGWLT